MRIGIVHPRAWPLVLLNPLFFLFPLSPVAQRGRKRIRGWVETCHGPPLSPFFSSGFLTFHPPSRFLLPVLSFQVSIVILVLEEKVEDLVLGKIKEWFTEMLYDIDSRFHRLWSSFVQFYP